MKLYNKALSASALSEKSSFTSCKLRFLSLRAAWKEYVILPLSALARHSSSKLDSALAYSQPSK